MTSSTVSPVVVPSTLSSRAISATAWTGGGMAAQFALRLGSNLIMTRLLVPDAYGMIAFATVFLTAMQLATDIGIGRSIVRERDGTDPRFLQVAWTVKILRSVVVAAGVLVLAGLFALFGDTLGQADSVFRQPEMPLLIAMVAIAPVLDGLASTNMDAMSRALAYRRTVPLEILGRLASILAMILFAQVSPTVWALLCGMLVSNLAMSFLGHVALPGPRMKLSWDRDIAARLWRFGKWIIGSSALTFVTRNADKFVLGALVSSTSFGLYAIAQIWVGIGQTVVDTVIGKVGFPAAAELLRERPHEARRGLRRGLHIIDVACIVLFVGLAGFGQWLTDTLYVAAYTGAGALIELLAPGLLALRFRMLGNVVLASGDSRSIFHVSLIGAVATVAGLAIGAQLAGMAGAITGLLLARLVPLPYLLMRSARFFGPGQTVYDAGWIGLCAVAALGMFALR
jgi:O-antigen/teichoic acid export membrane protein